MRSSRITAVVLACGLVATACGGGSGNSGSADVKNAALAPTGEAIQSGLIPERDGFAFPNFGAGVSPEELDGADLVEMFGSSADVCKDGVANPCVPTAEAAVWARMVNLARQAGHCEGFAVLAASRFAEKAEKPTIQLTQVPDVTNGIIRAFATQYLPSVQEETADWSKKSLADKVAVLTDDIADGKVDYSIGVYTKDGGHAVLPYSIETPSKDVARIYVYDSNWPGQKRWIDVDTKDESWTFSYSGADPTNDPTAWTGGSSDFDMTSMENRLTGKCPFCGSDTGVQKTILVLRSESADWSVSTADGELSPENRDASFGNARPVKSAEGDAPVDYVLVIDAAKPATFNLPGASRMTGVTPSAAVDFDAPAGADGGVVVQNNSISSSDPEVIVTLAAGDLAATANGAETKIEVGGDAITAEVTTKSGETISQTVNDATPTVEIKTEGNPALAAGISYEVAAQTGDAELTRTSVTADGNRSTTVENRVLDTTSVRPVLPPTLQYTEVSPVLPPAQERIAPVVPTTVATRNAALPTTTVAPTTTIAPTTTTVAPTTTVIAPTTTTRPRTTVKPTTTTVAPTTTTTPPTTTTVAATTTTATTTTSTTTTSTTTTVAPTTTVASTTTLAPTTTAAPTTTVAPTTTAAPTTTVAPTTTLPPPAPPRVVTASGPSGAVQATGGAAIDATGHTYHLGYFCGGSVTIGGVTAIGNTAPNGQYCDIYLVKSNTDGVVQWIKTFGGAGMYDFPDSIALDKDGNVYFTGAFWSQNSADFGNGKVLTDQTGGSGVNRFIVKLNSSGVAQWARVLGGSTTDSIGYALVGVGSSVVVYAPFASSSNKSTVNFGSLSVTNATPSTFLLRLDPSNGDPLSVTEIGGPGTTNGNSLSVDESGNAYVAGDFNGTALTIGGTTLVNGGPGTTDGFVAQFSPTGAPVWAKRFGGGGDESAWNVDTGSGIVAVAGVFTSTAMSFGTTNLTSSRPLSVGEQNLFLGKIDRSGLTLGAVTLGLGQYTSAAVRINDTESIYVAGSFTGTVRIGTTDATSRGGNDIYVLKASSDSGVKWSRTMGSAAPEYYESIALDGSRSPVVAFDSNVLVSGSPPAPQPTPVEIGSTNYTITNLSSFLVRVGREGALN